MVGGRGLPWAYSTRHTVQDSPLAGPIDGGGFTAHAPARGRWSVNSRRGPVPGGLQTGANSDPAAPTRTGQDHAPRARCRKTKAKQPPAPRPRPAGGDLTTAANASARPRRAGPAGRAGAVAGRREIPPPALVGRGRGGRGGSGTNWRVAETAAVPEMDSGRNLAAKAGLGLSSEGDGFGSRSLDGPARLEAAGRDRGRLVAVWGLVGARPGVCCCGSGFDRASASLDFCRDGVTASFAIRPNSNLSFFPFPALFWLGSSSRTPSRCR